MKQLFILLVLLVTGSLAATAQHLFISNKTDCVITMSVRSHVADEGCAVNQSYDYDFPPGQDLDLPTSAWPTGYPGGAPSSGQIWDSIKFYVHGDDDICGDEIGNPDCGFEDKWESGDCTCIGKTVHAEWSYSGSNIIAVFY